MKRESDREFSERRDHSGHTKVKENQPKKNVFDLLSKEGCPALIPERGFTPITRPRAQVLAVMDIEGLSERLPKCRDPGARGIGTSTMRSTVTSVIIRKIDMT